MDTTPLLAEREASGTKASNCRLVDQCFLSGGNTRSKREQQAVQTKLIIACALCFVFMILEVIGGYIAKSIAVMSDAAHMLSDVSSFALSLFATWAASQASHSSYSFGYHRAEIMGALVSVLIIWLVTGALLVEAVKRTITPTPVDGKIMTIVALAGIVFNVTVGLVLGHPHVHHGEDGHGCSGHGHSHGHGHGHSHGHSHGGGSKKKDKHKHKHASRSAGPLGEGLEDGSEHYVHGGHDCAGHHHDHDHHHDHPDATATPTSDVEAGIAPHSHFHGHEAHAGCSHGHDHSHGHSHGGDHSHGAGGHEHHHHDSHSDSDGDHHHHDHAHDHSHGACGHDHHHHDHDSHSDSDHEHHDHDHDHSHDHDSHSQHSHDHDEHDHEHGHHHDNINLRGAVLHVIGDLLQSIGVALAGALIWYNKGDPRFYYADPICTYVFSVLVLLTTRGILRDVMNTLMERSPTSIEIEAVQNKLTEIPGVLDVHDLHVWNLSSGIPILTAHVHISSAAQAQEVLEKLEKSVRKLGIKHSTIQICNPVGVVAV